jgi:F0F1-type ATP synthase assembly protein I
MVSAMHKFFESTRFLHTTSIVDMMSPDFNEQKSYAYGIIFNVSITVLFFVLWATILLILKFKGEDVGCASGRPFLTSTRNEDESLDRNGKSGGSGSTGSDDFDESSVEFGSDEADEKCKDVTRNRKRACRSRIAFLLTWITTIACVCIALVFGFSPLKEATANSKDYFSAIQDVIDQVSSSVRTIESAVGHATSAVQTTSLDFDTFCPNATSGEVLGVDLLGMATLMESEFIELENIMSKTFTTIKLFVEKAGTSLDDLEYAVEQTDKLLWAIPGILLGTAALTTTAMLAVLLAWKGRSGKVFQATMTYCVLPLLIVICVACWVTAIGASVATMVTGDACVGQVGPDEAIQNILQRHEVDLNSTIFQFLSAYTNGCKGRDPTQELYDLESRLQTSINTLWRHISTVDSIGRSELEAACGNSLESQLEAARNLAKSLTSIRKALDSTTATLKCDLVNPIYIDAVHGGLCDETADGAAWGFLFFFIIAITTMVMITMRSTWYHELEEEKVYDESEVAENMVLNEHEEYLAYISKYKHEWQEYRGFNSGSMSCDEGWDDENSENPGTCMGDDGSLSHLEEVWLDEDHEIDEEPTSSFEDQRSVDTDDISFPSLAMPGSDSFEEGDFNLMIPPPMLPPIDNSEEQDREPWEFAPMCGQVLPPILAPVVARRPDVKEQPVLLHSDSDEFKVDVDLHLVDSDFYEEIALSMEPAAIFVSSNNGSGDFIFTGLDKTCTEEQIEVTQAVSKRAPKYTLEVYDELMTNYSPESRDDVDRFTSLK